ncbi:MAG: dephospho-CoA kinase [Defluviitaleaceae bacterium]|nr:dephospho-CoA kinase [Defluviitaleaceae bacterium]
MESSSKPPGIPVIGLTGGSGCGKTLVSKMLGGFGGYVIDADDLSHRAILNGEPAYGEIVAQFGDEILNAQGEIDRKKLGEIVFKDKVKLRLIEGIIHPKVLDETKRAIKTAETEGVYGFAVIDAPMLVEAGAHIFCQSVWMVVAERESRIERIVLRDKISREAAVERILSKNDDGASLSFYIDTFINNDADKTKLLEKVSKAFGETAARIGIKQKDGRAGA